MYLFFRLCCGIVTLISMIFGITYEETNTYLFIYGEPAFLLLLTIVAFLFSKRKLLCFFIGCFELCTAMVVWNHYRLFTPHQACVQAYSDLEKFGELVDLDYISVNILFFVVLFIIGLCINLCLLIQKCDIKTDSKK